MHCVNRVYYKSEELIWRTSSFHGIEFIFIWLNHSHGIKPLATLESVCLSKFSFNTKNYISSENVSYLVVSSVKMSVMSVSQISSLFPTAFNQMLSPFGVCFALFIAFINLILLSVQCARRDWTQVTVGIAKSTKSDDSKLIEVKLAAGTRFFVLSRDCKQKQFNAIERLQGKFVKMLNIFKSKRKHIGYKITTADRSKKVGIAADSLKTFKRKCSEKFQVFQSRCDRFYVFSDVELLF